MNPILLLIPLGAFALIEPSDSFVRRVSKYVKIFALAYIEALRKRVPDPEKAAQELAEKTVRTAIKLVRYGVLAAVAYAIGKQHS